MQQKRIAIMSNSGGVGKTTLAVNLAYQFARKKKTVALLGCDPNGSLTLFCGLDDPTKDDGSLDFDQTMYSVLSSDFQGEYPLFQAWPGTVDGVDTILGGLVLTDAVNRLSVTDRSEYLLLDHLDDYPLPHDIIIFDCPGTIEQLHTCVLAAATDVVIILKPEDKDIDAVAKLIQWFFEKRKKLRLDKLREHPPMIRGVLPNGFKDRAMHRDNMGIGKLPEDETLVGIMQAMEIELFPKIKDAADIANAGANGLPLGIFRPGNAANKVYEHIATRLMEN